MQRSSINLLHEAFQQGSLTHERYLDDLHFLLSQQDKLFAGDVILHRQRKTIQESLELAILDATSEEQKGNSVFADLFCQLLTFNNKPRGNEQKNFRNRLIKHYGCQREVDGLQQIWCPVMRYFASAADMKAAHIVPYRLGYETMGDIFNGDGKAMMWSLGNGLMMSSKMEKLFDRHIFCLLPVKKTGEEDGWKLVLVNEQYRQEPVTPSCVLNDYDGKELVFCNDARPQKRFLYLHYFVCIHKAMREKQKGWENLQRNARSNLIWATPGPYLRASMLKKLALTIGEVEFASELVIGCDLGIPNLPSEAEDIGLKGLVSALAGSQKEDDREEDEDNDDDDDDAQESDDNDEP
ncbi:hypothetical protein PVAG01_04180 [Phlyctema vagabunda]|uniref:HNH nuclease domain-containing protein n=1 Tax=Phlyctema vagabunda TaxID=108571 RepID=A0ABR4PNL1_9HELO